MAKPITDEFLELSIYGFRRKGFWRYMFGTISWSWGNNPPHASIGYSILGDTIQLSWTSHGEEFIQDIPLASVSVGYGQKYFFCCPSCGRHVAILYAGQKFYCRHCYGITYESCQKSHDTFPKKLGFKTDSQFRNFMKTAEYEKTLMERHRDKGKRVGKAMLRRLTRYREKSGVKNAYHQVFSVLEKML